MKTARVNRLCQTTETNCGPTALAQLFSFYGNNVDPQDIEKRIAMAEIGTLDGFLGQAAIKYGYKTRITPQNLFVFDPTWTGLANRDLVAKLREFKEITKNKGLKLSLTGYIGFLEMGGKIDFKTLSVKLLVEKFKKHPVLIGLCSTYLYGIARPANAAANYRDGHFVVLESYDQKTDKFSVIDPYHSIPFSKSGRYKVKSDRLIESMFLAEATYDCAILEIWK